jgi:hypothetical protein
MFVGTRMNATRTQESQELSFTRMTGAPDRVSLSESMRAAATGAVKAGRHCPKRVVWCAKSGDKR